MRLIDGDKLIDIITNSADLGGVWGQVLKAVKDAFIRLIRTMPNVNPEPHWIPCSDHTPDTPMRVQVQLENGWIITAYRQEDEWLSVPDCGDVLRDECVVAWMPLPELWGGDAE